MWLTAGGQRKYCRLRKLMSVYCPGSLSPRMCAGRFQRKVQRQRVSSRRRPWWRELAIRRPALDSKGRLHTFCHAIPDRWHVMGVTQAAGLSLRWFRDQFGLARDDGRDPYDRLSDEAASVPAGSEGLFWAPYLMGERTPHLDPNVRGALVGLSALHTRAHVIRAIQEGVAFSLKDTFSIFEEMKVPVTKIRLGGGGARSSVWRQIQADVYAHEVELVEAEEGAAYGAAILAAVGARHWNSVDEACDSVVRVAARVAPRADSSKLMQKNYSIYRRVYPALRGINTSDSAHQSA